MQLGDWVQVTVDTIIDRGGDGSLCLVAAEQGDVGHILEEIEPGWYNVFFERTGAVCACGDDELIWLCDADGNQVRLPARPEHAPAAGEMKRHLE
jgi:hypothetical protein